MLKSLGESKDELTLTASLDEGTNSCQAEGAYAQNTVYLLTRRNDWIDLDDQCAASKSGSGNDSSRRKCYDQSYASCSIWPSITCRASLDKVTVTSVGQEDDTCVHSIKKTTATTATTTSTSATTTTSAVQPEPRTDNSSEKLFNTSYLISWVAAKTYGFNECEVPSSSLHANCGGCKGEIEILRNEPDKHKCDINPDDPSHIVCHICNAIISLILT